MRVLAIETSCDETGVAIYDSAAGLLADVLYTQADLQNEFGGVVPELASRDHIRKTLPLVDDVLKKANLMPADIDGIAYTAGPGLAGALLVGAMLAKSLAFAWEIPSIAIHHMEGHLLAPMLEAKKPEFPFLALLVSGGHTLLIDVKKIGHYEIVGDTLDDAVGEAFDKTARLLGLPYPGGAALAKLAEQGNLQRFHFPRPMVDRPGLDFSFSGLKTSVVHALQNLTLDEQTRADIAAAFQAAVVETLVIKCKRALKQTNLTRLIVAGGVSANKLLRQQLTAMVTASNGEVFFPKLEFCTDNGAMIAYAGCQRLLAGEHDRDLTVQIKPRWSLQDLNSFLVER